MTRVEREQHAQAAGPLVRAGDAGTPVARREPDLLDRVRGSLAPATEDLLARRLEMPEFKRRGWIVRRALVVADVVGLTLAYVAMQIFFTLGDRHQIDGLRGATIFLAVVPLWLLAAKLGGLYERDEERTDHSTTDDFVGVFQMVSAGILALMVIVWTTQPADINSGKIACFWLLALLGIASARGVARIYCRRHVLYLQNTVIIGAGAVGQKVAAKLLKHPEYGINLVGFVDRLSGDWDERLAPLAYLGPPDVLPSLVRPFDIERVIVAFPDEEHEATLTLVRALADTDVQVDIVPRLYDLISPGLSIHTVEGLPLIGLPPPRLGRSSLLVKRGFDIVISALALVALAPAFGFLAWRIKRDSPGPVFYRQLRMGRGNEPFQILKFRTMVCDADERKHDLAHLNRYASGNGAAPMFKVDDDPRVTRVGRTLRRRFLDELPQLINVLRGDMSLVGPRPLVLDEDRHVDEWRRGRLRLKPGMTGLWQVLGRNDIGFDEMLRLDYLYVSNWSLWRDCRLILQTVPLVVKGAAAV